MRGWSDFTPPVTGRVPQSARKGGREERAEGGKGGKGRGRRRREGRKEVREDGRREGENGRKECYPSWFHFLLLVSGSVLVPPPMDSLVLFDTLRHLFSRHRVYLCLFVCLFVYFDVLFVFRVLGKYFSISWQTVFMACNLFFIFTPHSRYVPASLPTYFF